MPIESEREFRMAGAAPSRQCPTMAGDLHALITHQIGVPICLERQRGLYHKCHRCAYRGKAASHVEPGDATPSPDAPSVQL